MHRKITITRNGLGMSLREFSSALGVSYETIRLWELGRMRPSVERLIKIYRSADDWRRQWAAEMLAAEYPAVWEAINVPAD